MTEIGVRAASLGMPASSEQAADEVVALARYLREARLPLEANCAARTLVSDIEPIVEAVQRAGQPIVVHAFIGSSPIRLRSEGWDIEFVRRSASTAVDFAVRQGLEVAFITEDTTRTSPEVLDVLLRTALDHGASRLILCDTVGHATPEGASALVRWVRSLVTRAGAEATLEWHGHNDRGLALSNAMAAAQAGADRIHACAVGVGERVGNTPMELLLLNAQLLGWIDQDLSTLAAYAERAAEMCGFTIPANYPLLGADAFRTSTGVHAAAIIKALGQGDAHLADRVYSAVPAAAFGRRQEIEVGPLSGLSNVLFWLGERGIPPKPALCQEILAVAKRSRATLTDAALWEIVERRRSDEASEAES